MGTGIRPLRRFSQNFLTDPAFARRLVSAFDPKPSDTILEIGPGEGVLTRELLASGAGRVIAVEIDTRCSRWLRSEFAGEPRFHLIEGDFLKTDLEPLRPEGGKLRVAGNIPYAITSPILFRLLDLRDGVRDFALTMQKEVAERLASPPGSKAYGIPSVLFQLHADIRILFLIPPGAFRPAPSVESAVLYGAFLDAPRWPVRDESFFRGLVKTAFGQRRKMLRRSLSGRLRSESVRERLNEFLERRPETLSVREWTILADRLQEADPEASRESNRIFPSGFGD
jgi:16S rRNA (adenine1518-N6/adenine1519-N6)-dimethyltransferase